MHCCWEEFYSRQIILHLKSGWLGKGRSWTMSVGYHVLLKDIERYKKQIFGLFVVFMFHFINK